MSLLAKTSGCPRRPVETRGQELDTHRSTRRAHTRQRGTIPGADAQVKTPPLIDPIGSPPWSAQAHTLHASTGSGKSLEPDRRDLASAPLAGTVGSGREPRDRRVDLADLRLGVGDQRGDLRSLERDRRPLGIVLVVVGGQPRSFDHRRKFGPKRRQSTVGTRPLGPQYCSDVRHRTSRHPDRRRDQFLRLTRTELEEDGSPDRGLGRGFRSS